MKQEELKQVEEKNLPKVGRGVLEISREKAVETISDESEQVISEQDEKLEMSITNLGFSDEEADALKQETGIGAELNTNTNEIRTLAEKVMDKLKVGLRVLGVTLPIAMGQGNALAQNTFEASKLNQAVATEEVQAEKAKMLELKSFGGQEKISSEEWKIFERYRQLALTEEKEKSETYAVLPDGSVLVAMAQIEGSNASVSPDFNDFSSGIGNLVKLIEEHPEIKVTGIHQHPIHMYNDDIPAWEILQLKTASAEDATEKKTIIENIKNRKIFSAWPPSNMDIRMSLNVRGEATIRAVDANGVWTYGVDKDSPVGKGLLARFAKVQEKEEATISSDLSDVDILKTAESADDIQKAGETLVTQMSTEGANTLAEQEEIAFLWSTGSKDLLEYQARQFDVAKPTDDWNEWEKKITDFISYCNKQGLRVTYTPFDQHQENTNDSVTLSPNMTSTKIDQAAIDAVRNYEQTHE